MQLSLTNRNSNKNKKENSDNVTKQEVEKPNNGKSVSFFKLEFSLATKFDIFIIILGFLSSLGLAISMPLFSILFGGTLNNLGSDPIALFESIKELCLKFVYVGLGMFAAGALMICCWSYSGRTIANYIKEKYFLLVMNQEQGWFDQQEVFEFSTRIQSQTKIIENGVIINSIFIKIIVFIL